MLVKGATGCNKNWERGLNPFNPFNQDNTKQSLCNFSAIYCKCTISSCVKIDYLSMPVLAIRNSADICCLEVALYFILQCITLSSWNKWTVVRYSTLNVHRTGHNHNDILEYVGWQSRNKHSLCEFVSHKMACQEGTITMVSLEHESN